MDRNAANDLFRREVVRRGLLSEAALANAEAHAAGGGSRDLVHAVVETGLMSANQVKDVLRAVVEQARASQAGAPAPAVLVPAAPPSLTPSQREERIRKADTETLDTAPNARIVVQPGDEKDPEKEKARAKVAKPRVVHADISDQTLGGRFQVIKLIGTGGMGAVWLARDTMLEKEVAIKVLPRTLTHDEQYRARFLREARAAARLEAHPNIVSVTYCDHDATFDLLYMVMQFINGVSLQDLCDTELKGPVPEETAVPIIRQTLDALGFAQRAGIVHRDIKPDNIIIERDTHRPWVTDFGLARFEQQASTLTAQGQVMGTPHFMSPEQCEGKVVDGRADLYAAGCVFYYMLTHEYAFDGATTTAVIIAQLRKQPKPLHELVPTISPWLERLVLKLLSKKADQRYQTAEEAIADLDAGWAGRGATGAGGGGGSAAGSGAGYHVAHLAHDEGYAEALPAVAMADDDGLGAVAEQVAYASADDVQMPGSGDAYAAGGQRNASISGRRPRRNADGTSARRAAVARRDPRSSSGTGTDRVAPPGAGGSGGASDSGDENQRFDRRNAIAAPVGSVAARRRGGTDRYPDGGASGDTIRRGPDMHVVIFVIIGVIVAVGVAALILFSNR